MPLDNPTANGAIIASGSYTGNDSANRAIPHGLPKTPRRVVIITRISGSIWNDTQIRAGIAYLFNVQFNAAAILSYNYSITPMDSTNFYVGNVSDYDLSANGNTVVYNWVAIG